MPRIVLLHISLIILLILVGCQSPSPLPTSGKVSIASLQSLVVEASQPIVNDIYIEGRVVANDKLNELEQAIVIDDTSAGIELKIECRGVIDDIVPLFSHVRLRCSGLNVGREGSKLVIGAKPTGEFVVDRLSEDRLNNHLEIFEDYLLTATARELRIEDISHELVLSYVRISDIQVIDEDADKCWCDTAEDGPNSHVTSLRRFSDGQDTIAVVTSGRCNYAGAAVPTQRCNITGIIDWYDKEFALRITSDQIETSR